jgi:hypothetical protein
MIFSCKAVVSPPNEMLFRLLSLNCFISNYFISRSGGVIFL